jgi:pilus assembly protein CpaF
MSLLERLGRPEGVEAPKPIFAERKSEVTEDEYQGIKLEIHRRIVDEMSAEQQELLTSAQQDSTTRQEIEDVITEYCNRVLAENPFAVPRGDRSSIVADVRDEMLGLGPIEPLLKDETITEIMINGPKHIFVERMGKLHLTSVQFHDDAHLMNIIERILAPIGRRIDESSPLVDARLDDGSRVNIIIPPLSLVGPCLTIRKFARNPLTVENLIGFGTLSESMAIFMRACVKARLNILVSGGTGSGKTTTLNVLSSFIPTDERIVTIEDAAELRLMQEHVVTLEARPANIEGSGEITIRDLVRNALRMRPDRIIVGEVRSGEALDMLQAMNTGHDGSLTTAHANSPRDVLSRLETMVLMSGMELPVRAIREQISSAIDLILHQSRIHDGSRRVTYITEVQNMEGNTIILQDIFRFEQTGIDEKGKVLGHFTSTGIKPKFMEKFKMQGITFPENIFFADEEMITNEGGNFK